MTIFSKQVEKLRIETDNEFFGIFRTLHPASGWAVDLINQRPDRSEHTTDDWKSWIEAMPKGGVPSDADESHRGVSEGKGSNVSDLEERPKKLGGCVTPLGAPRLPGMWLSFERHTYCRSRCILLCTGIRRPPSTPLCPRRTRTSGRSFRSGPFSNEQKDRRRSNNLCMYCGHAGHIIHVCPQNGKAPARKV